MFNLKNRVTINVFRVCSTALMPMAVIWWWCSTTAHCIPNFSSVRPAASAQPPHKCQSSARGSCADTRDAHKSSGNCRFGCNRRRRVIHIYSVYIDCARGIMLTIFIYMLFVRNSTSNAMRFCRGCVHIRIYIIYDELNLYAQARECAVALGAEFWIIAVSRRRGGGHNNRIGYRPRTMCGWMYVCVCVCGTSS